MKVLIVTLLLLSSLIANNEEFDDFKGNALLQKIATVSKFKAYAITTVAEMEKCKKVKIESIDNDFIEKLNSKYQDLILATEVIFQAEPNNIKTNASLIIREHCSSKESKNKKKVSQNSFMLDEAMDIELITGISENLNDGVYPIMFKMSNDCKMIAKVKVNGSNIKALPEVISCKDKKKAIIGYITNENYLIENFTFNQINKKYKLIITK